jgi:hypothetical protein
MTVIVTTVEGNERRVGLYFTGNLSWWLHHPQTTKIPPTPTLPSRGEGDKAIF